MAMNVDLKSALALVVSEPRERQTYSGTGDARVVSGRLVDIAGRPLSGCSALVLTDAFGLASDAAVLVPDSQIAALVPGSVVRLDGELHARLVGGDYGSIRTTVWVTAGESGWHSWSWSWAWWYCAVGGGYARPRSRRAWRVRIGGG